MDYQSYCQQGLRYMVFAILKDVQEQGIEPDHAYYLTFETNRPDVILPDFVREKYPETITLVMENQFQNLTVTPQKIMVELSFGGVYYPVTIPLKALTQFSDPNHNFGLALIPAESDIPVEQPAKIINLDSLRRK